MLNPVIQKCETASGSSPGHQPQEYGYHAATETFFNALTDSLGNSSGNAGLRRVR